MPLFSIVFSFIPLHKMEFLTFSCKNSRFYRLEDAVTAFEALSYSYMYIAHHFKGISLISVNESEFSKYFMK